MSLSLLGKQQTFARMICKLIIDAVDLGYGVTLGEAYRPQATCDWYAAHGMGISHSNHQKRLAIDLNLFKNGVFLTSVDDYRELGEWWEAQSTPDVTCCWGGRFSKPDADHFSFEDSGTK